MKRWIFVLTVLGGLLAGAPGASAQWATFDASNLAQAVLSFLQDGDNMVLNTEQFLENLGVAKEQLEYLQEMDKRYKEVRGDIYKAQSVIRIAKNYEMIARMFTRYVQTLTQLKGQQITYARGRSLVNQGFQYLLYASREVKRAREFLDKKSQVSEEERLKGLLECDRQISKASSAMYYHIRDSYADIDAGIRMAEAVESLDEVFKNKY
ncbi:MAG: hypothetical protein IKZ60_06945 [Bacteroidales bacterium]|nr:hypothetical protein [Bacteroidales bacterium]